METKRETFDFDRYENICGTRKNVDDMKKDKAKRHKNIAEEMKAIFKQRMELKKYIHHFRLRNGYNSYSPLIF